MLWPFQDTPKLLNVKYHLYMTLAKLMENVAIISIFKKRSAMSTTNHGWLVIISLNLNLALRLLF